MLVSKEECLYCPYCKFDEDGLLVCNFERSSGETPPCEKNKKETGNVLQSRK